MNTIPSTDATLRGAVERVVASQPPESAKSLEERLRPFFPHVAVFRREISGEAPGYYVYRDGGYVRDSAEHWWEAPGIARIRVSPETGELTHATASSAALLGLERNELIGRHFSDFLLPEAGALAEAMFAAVLAEREVRSVAQLVRRDGSLLAIEFHAARCDGTVEVRYRPIPS